MLLKIKKLDPRAKVPIRGSKEAAGYDIHYTGFYSEVLKPGQSITLDCGFALEIPQGYYIAIVPRSSMGKKGIIIKNSPGTIDSDYRASFKVMLQNIGDESYTIYSGDRIAQMILHKYETMEFEEVDELSLTERGEGGFGSTGN